MEIFWNKQTNKKKRSLANSRKSQCTGSCVLIKEPQVTYLWLTGYVGHNIFTVLQKLQGTKRQLKHLWWLLYIHFTCKQLLWLPQEYCTIVTLYRCEHKQNWNTKHWQDAPDPRVPKSSCWVLLETPPGIWNQTEVSSSPSIGWASIPQKLIVTPSTPNSKLMAQQTEFCSELLITHTRTHLSYLQLKHVNR